MKVLTFLGCTDFVFNCPIWLTFLIRLIQSHLGYHVMVPFSRSVLRQNTYWAGILSCCPIWIFARLQGCVIAKKRYYSQRVGNDPNLESLISEGLLWTGLLVGLRRIPGDGWRGFISQNKSRKSK